MIVSLILGFNLLVFLYFVALNGFYLFQVILGFIGIRRYKRSLFLLEAEELVQSTFVRPVSLIATAYNEGKSIVASVSSLLQLHYPLYEIIIVNDGSTDDTLPRLITDFQMKPAFLHYRHQLPCKEIRGIYISSAYPNLVVVDKYNGHKSDAMNAGINVSRYPMFCGLDADSLLNRETLLLAMRPFYEDPATLAVGVCIGAINECVVDHGDLKEARVPRNFLAGCQVVEYLRSFLYGRIGLDEIGGLIIVSGAFGLFNKQAVVAAGGYDPSAIGEDFDLLVRLRKWAYQNLDFHRVRYIPKILCWTEVPSTLTSFRRQRSRWMRGLMEVLWKQKSMILNPKYDMVGMVSLPFFVIFEFAAPVIELTGYIVFFLSWFLGYLNTEFAFWFLMISMVMGSALSIAGIILMEIIDPRYRRLSDILRLMVYAVAENVGLHQLHTAFRIYGIWEMIVGKRGWGVMGKTGFKKQE